MTQLTAPIELTDDELVAVSGGNLVPVGSAHVHVGIAQAISQDAAIIQSGGHLSIGGGNGSTSFSGTLTANQTFAATISQSATNTNSGSVTATVTVR